MKKRRRLNLIHIILVVVLVLGLGYAYLTTNLSINGTTNVDSNTWNVYWDNVQVQEGSVSGAQVMQAPTIDSTKTNISFSVRLSKPGDYYEFTVDAKNDGSIDAMIDSINESLNGNNETPEYINMIVQYADSAAIEENQILKSNTKETISVRIEFSKQVYPDELPETNLSLTASFGMEYVQADESATEIRSEVFYVGYASTTIGEPLPEGITTYTNYQDAITAFGQPYFIKHVVANNIIIESYVGYIYNNQLIYLKGHKITKENDNIYFEMNKNTLINTFGANNCGEDLHMVGFYECIHQDPYDRYISIGIDTSDVIVTDNYSHFCEISYDGDSRCA